MSTREEQFREELRSLLERYDAEITVTTERRGYGNVELMVVEFNSKVEDGEIVHEYESFDIGRWCSATGV